MRPCSSAGSGSPPSWPGTLAAPKPDLVMVTGAAGAGQYARCCTAGLLPALARGVAAARLAVLAAASA